MDLEGNEQCFSSNIGGFSGTAKIQDFRRKSVGYWGFTHLSRDIIDMKEQQVHHVAKQHEGTAEQHHDEKMLGD